MPAKHHSRATKLAATYLAKLASPDVAAATFRVDVRTVRGWVQGIELPDDEWTAIRDVLRARGAEMAAKGETRGLVQTLTAAGISDRNVRYSTLIARREARREAEPDAEAEPDPVHDAIHALDDRRSSLLAASIRLELSSRNLPGAAALPADHDDPASDADHQARILAVVAHLASMSDEAVAAEREAIRARALEVHAAIEAEYEQRPAAAAPTPPAPIAPVAAPEPPRPKLRSVVTLDDYDPSQWQPLRRYDP